MSYWPPPPVRMSVTISSDVPAYFGWILQPVCFTKGFTHFASRYPSQAIIVSLPSPLPIFDGNPLAVPAPEAGTHSAAAKTATSTCTLRIFLMLFLLVGSRKCARHATRDAPAYPLTRARPARTSRGSAVRL